jgi:ZIP family zinc transporter
MQSVFLYALIPFVTFILGGIVAKIRQPSNTWRSVIQHFSSGVVFAVVAVDLLLSISKSHEPYEVAIGFSCGCSASTLFSLKRWKVLHAF